MVKNMSSKEFEKLLAPMVKLRAEEKEKREKLERYLKESSVDKLVLKADLLENLISVEHNKGIRASSALDNLYDFSLKVESALQKRLFEGERLNCPLFKGKDKFEPSLIEYAFVNFQRKMDTDVGDISKSALFYLPKMKSFENATEDLKGEMFLFTESSSNYGSEHNFELRRAFKGNILGKPEFRVHQMGEYHHRSLYLKTDNLESIFTSQGWKKEKEKEFALGDNFIKEYSEGKEFAKMFLVGDKGDNKGFVLSHTDGPYYGGSTAYVRQDLYLGDKNVKSVLGSRLKLKIVLENEIVL